ncbi:hypothetical protein F2Q69_00028291 [Brassica cretica]|uniref:Uncharacterized protein n=1 Tax=Brassica cretica TaxID=69181 RepID=A0A8S9RYU9_BRACR|nr:hypothetical protein F2Q69_00028291 [Brassica cretica]
MCVENRAGSLKFSQFCLQRPYASSCRRVPPPLSFLFSSFLFDPSLPLRSHPICGRLWVFELSPAEEPRPIPVGVSFFLVTLRGWLREARGFGWRLLRPGSARQPSFIVFRLGTTRSSLKGALVVVAGSVVWRSGTPSIGVCGYDMDIVSESSMASSHSVFVELPTCPPLCICAQLRRRWWFALLNRLQPSLGSSSAALYVPCVDSVPFGNPVSILVLRVCPRPCICLLLSLRLVESRWCYGFSSSFQFRSLWLACFLRWMDSSGLLRRSGMSKWSFCCLQNLFVGLWRKPSRLRQINARSRCGGGLRL